MIAQKGPPCLGGWLTLLEQILCNGCLGNLDAEHLQLAVNPWCAAPADVVSRHRSDQFAHLGCDGWSPAYPAAGLPGPVQSKALAMPAHQGVQFEDLQCLQAVRPQAVEPDPEQPLTPVKSESFAWCLVYHGQLLAERQDFEM